MRWPPLSHPTNIITLFVRGPARRQQQISMYSFGAPRAGNRLFADEYNRVVRDSWRCTNSKDVVPSVPRLLGYAHVR